MDQGHPTMYDRAVTLRRIAPELTPLTVTQMPASWPQHHATGPTHQYDWLFYTADNDPLVTRRTLTMPPSVRDTLRNLDRRGVRFDQLLIGHEVEKTALRGVDLSDSPRLARLLELDTATAPTTAGVRFLERAAAVALAAGRAAVAPLAVLAADPVLIGALTDSGRARPGDRTALFGIARWT